MVRSSTRQAMCGAALLLLGGCGEAMGPGGSDAPGNGEVTVLAKAGGWRDGLQETAGHPYLWIEVAADPTTARQAWEDNVPTGLPEGDGRPAEPGIYVPFEDVDLDTHALVVVSSGESGTCPVWVEDLRFLDDRVEVDLDTAGGEACTDDFNPYRLVLAVDRDRLPSTDDLPFTTIDVPSENLVDVEGQMVRYPG